MKTVVKRGKKMNEQTSLIPETILRRKDGSQKISVVDENEVTRVPLNKIRTSRNSRTMIAYEELEGLMQSIKQTGLLQPIGLMKSGNGYEIAFGNRRFLACAKLGWTSIPAIIRTSKHEFDIDIQNLTENVQRRNIGLAEIGRYILLLDKDGLSEREVAVRLGVSPKYVNECVRAFKAVPEKFRDDIVVQNTGSLNRGKGHVTEPGKITMRQTTAILSASKTYNVTKVDQEALFKTAKKHGPKFKAENVRKYLANIQHGKDPFCDSVDTKELYCHLQVSVREYDRLTKKYVTEGPFSSLRKLVPAILSGQISEKINIIIS